MLNKFDEQSYKQTLKLFFTEIEAVEFMLFKVYLKTNNKTFHL